MHLRKNTSTQVSVNNPIRIAVDVGEVKSCASSNKRVATVTKDGRVTPIKPGTAKITVRLKNKKKLTLKVKVVDPLAPKSVRLLQGKKAKLKVGQTLVLGAQLTPDTARSALTWKSGNRRVATVDAQGVVTAKSPGSVKITVTTANRKKAAITLRVVK